ncbi:response regulator transcription factor [Clostridium brassicae]|uniref:Stage 0 sporulation protein A homolog n=1 Tax=Clostridium brassicae TaxID=2999072 RepID=A0ABT4DCZ9_9CLOT|nr:response regulator [Clostridium brassicae]MCY6960170.1 response regulator [Clostridium brassicae]
MCKIILADDEHLEIEALKIIIDKKVKMASVVGEAHNGEEVIQMNDDLNPDIIVMDIVMPGMNGLEVAELIKKKDKNKKIILISAYDDFELVQKALRIKVDDYLLKPIRPEKIVKVLKSLMNIDNKNLFYTDELKCALNYIENNFRDNIMLKDVANYMKFSTTYLSKRFKKDMGTNFNKYLTQKRIEEAKKMLESTNISINDIAFDVGYNEPNYFCKVFKKLEGVTPSEYRCRRRKTSLI